MTAQQTYRQLCSQELSIRVFNQDWWWDAVAPDWNVVTTRQGDRISGAWMYQAERKAGVTLLRNPVLTPYNGPSIFYPPDLKSSKRDNYEYEVAEELLSLLPAAKVWSMALPPGFKHAGLLKRNGFTTDVRQTFLMPLEAPEEEIFLRLNEDYRRNIRKANTEITITEEPDQLPQLYQYLLATLNGKGVKLPYPQALLQNVLDACIAHQCGTLVVARKAGVVQAMQLCVWDADCAYYLAGAKNPAAKDNKAMTSILWHCMSMAKQKGKKAFDFEGSMDKGVEKFFRNFGAERELYLTINQKSSFLWKIKELLGK